MAYLSGIDVSSWQRTTPSLAGLRFLFARSTYGRFSDGMYHTHIGNARAAGLLVGAYHFGVGDESVSTQVSAFLSNAGKVDFYVLDLEKNGARQAMTQAQAKQFISAVRATGRKIGLYASESGYPLLGQDYNWVAKWSDVPPSNHWTFWQYSGSPLDRDHYIGSQTSLLELAGRTVLTHPLSHTLHFDTRSFWVYKVTNGRIVSRYAKRFNGDTRAPCTAPVNTQWPMHGSRNLVRITAGALAGQYVSVPQSAVELT